MPRNAFYSIVFAVFVCLFSVQAFAEVLTMGSALNKAGRQRMLTQNIMKNYLAVGLEVDVVRAREELDRSVALFEEQFQELTEYAPSKKISASLSTVEVLWFEYRSLALNKVSRENAAKILDRNNTILAACHQVVLDLEAFANRESAKMVNTSGRQRMLSQRIAAYYFAHAWGFRDAEFVAEFEKAKGEYDTGLKTLTAFNKNSNDINKALKKVQAQWDFSNTGFRLLEDGNYVPHVISVTTRGMLKRMDAITHLYEDLDLSLSAGAVASNSTEP